MDFDDDKVLRQGLPMGRFPEGSHPEVLARLSELMSKSASPSRSAHTLKTLARHCTEGAELLQEALKAPPSGTRQ
jgi:hypothetical protein